MHKKSSNFLTSMAQDAYYGFSVGDMRFIAMNVFDALDPKSFSVLPQQMEWLGHQLEKAGIRKQTKVLLLQRCPSDLKVGDKELRKLVRHYGVRLIDMGHTHYNEIANDGHTL